MRLILTKTGVLVAISIPIFTSQLEKSREATDMANIRSAYAEVAAASLTDPDTDHTANVPLKQTQANWQTTGQQIAGIEVTADLWNVAKGGSVEVKYTAGSDGSGTVTIGGTPVKSGYLS